ncbi:von Willebrand factor type A domain protein [Polystyrenella longa]|uniref:von Willebrand factor type A domain protein n=2 Tax=Polystyrenella longa TaxID=2528007 RepID=A0A518CN94_9PLAN|nr:von Willebrand factor type A domain protein [Polystyrenella longa]
MKTTTIRTDLPREEKRKGAFMILTFFGIMATAGFLAMSIDLGVVAVFKVRMQNVADAAALAAAQEISIALDEISDQISSGNVQGEVQDANSYAQDQARVMAEHVAELNGMFIDPQIDVLFGQRTLDENSGEATITWGVSPFNAVKVIVRKDNPSQTAPDAKVDLFFAKMFDNDQVALRAEAVAYIDSRDLVVVMDFSGSMVYDSLWRSDSIDKLGQQAIDDGLYNIWTDLDSPTYGNMQFDNDWITIPSDSSSSPKVSLTWKKSTVDITTTKQLDYARLYFSDNKYQNFSSLSGQSKTLSGTGSNSGKLIKYAKVRYKENGREYYADFDLFDYDTLKRGLDLNGVNYPYPSGSWNSFISYCLNDSEVNRAGYRYQFGMMNLVHYWLDAQMPYSSTPELWKTRHYPFNAVKSGGSLLCEFLDGLDFGDHLGLVTYDTYHRVESQLVPDGWVSESVDIGATPITDDYSAIDTIQKHKQAAHYYNTTNVGGGLHEAIKLLDEHSRYGSQKTILLMTDGNANTSDNNWSVPSDFSWNAMTDYNGDGVADYTTSDSHKLYTFVRVKQAIDKGYTIHTMSVGANADRDFMKAIAFAGDGIWVDVPGGTTVAAMEEQMLQAFARIAANVPPPKLTHSESP